VVIALDVALIAATPMAGHYAIDLIGGAAVMLVSVVVARRLCAPGQQPSSFAADRAKAVAATAEP
jgi:membrane-associated phospholipid phosphatase